MSPRRFAVLNSKIPVNFMRQNEWKKGRNVWFLQFKLPVFATADFNVDFGQVPSSYLGVLDALGALDELGLLYPVENGAWNLPMFSRTIP